MHAPTQQEVDQAYARQAKAEAEMAEAKEREFTKYVTKGGRLKTPKPRAVIVANRTRERRNRRAARRRR